MTCDIQWTNQRKRIYLAVLHSGCVKGRRKPGRPRTRWIDQIKSMVGCPLQELYNLVQDRQRWCDVVAVASCQSWQDRTDRPTAFRTLFVSSWASNFPELLGQLASYFQSWALALLFCPINDLLRVLLRHCLLHHDTIKDWNSLPYNITTIQDKKNLELILLGTSSSIT